SAVFAPVRALGVVVVDEEHDGSFKQEEGVRYHGRDLAVVRAQKAGAVAVPGSATPSLESYRNAALDRFRRLLLPTRANPRAADSGRGAERLLKQVHDGEIDILVGTQMVTKGHDFEKVTLVGVLQPDQGMHLPDFRAAERTFQLLEQVAGRAGRGERPGRVLVQTYNPQHPAIECLRTHDYEGFVKGERAE